MCPEVDPPAEPSFHAFSFTVARRRRRAELRDRRQRARRREGGASYRERTIRHGETSADALREKAHYVLGEMERRLAAFDLSWADTTATQVYTVHDLHPFLADEIVRRGAARSGLTWHYARPPVRELEYEMDCRGVSVRTRGVRSGSRRPVRALMFDDASCGAPHHEATALGTGARQASSCALSCPRSRLRPISTSLFVLGPSHRLSSREKRFATR